jgi:hypothetical protein
MATFFVCSSKKRHFENIFADNSRINYPVIYKYYGVLIINAVSEINELINFREKGAAALPPRPEKTIAARKRQGLKGLAPARIKNASGPGSGTGAGSFEL